MGSKGALADTLATATELKKAQCAKVLDVLAEVATKEVKKTGVFAIPGLTRLKLKTKPATKAGKREVLSGDGEGETSEEDCQSLSSSSLEASHLNNAYQPCACWFIWIADRRASCGTILPVHFCI